MDRDEMVRQIREAQGPDTGAELWPDSALCREIGRMRRRRASSESVDLLARALRGDGEG